MNIASGKIRISDAKAQRILNLIEEGTLKVGDKLPGQRDLARQMGVGRSSLREAIRNLEMLGVLETRPGLGTFVKSDVPNKIDSGLSAWLHDHQDEVEKVFEVREALEGKAAELAALSATETQINEMEKILHEMEKAANTETIFKLVETDADFHNLLVKMSGNEFLNQIVSDIQDALVESRYALLTVPGRAEQSIKEHYSVLEAITSRDSEMAKEAMELHLKNALGEIKNS